MGNNTSTSTTLIEISPGIYLDPLRRKEIAPRNNGMLLLRGDESWARIGLTPSQAQTLRRLGEIGEIKLYPFAPHSMLLDMQSWEEHKARVLADPWYWEPGKGNIERYRGRKW
jgi:hypothetical protein